MEFSISGIQCDNKKCDYDDKEVARETYSEYVNKPCPKCGENLLTQEDFEAVNKLYDGFDTISELTNKIQTEIDRVHDEDGEEIWIEGTIQSDTKEKFGVKLEPFRKVKK